MIRIMIVDDELPIREWLQFSLEKTQLPLQICAVCSNGREAIEAFQVHHPQLVFTDIKMPGKDGIAVLQQLRAFDPSVYVVMLTSYDNFEYARRSLKYQANEYVLKAEINNDVLVRIYNSCKLHMETNTVPATQYPVSNTYLSELFPMILGGQSYNEEALLSQLSHNVTQADFQRFFVAAVPLTQMLKTNHWQEGLQSLVLPLQASIQTFYYDRRTMLLLVSVGSSHSLARSLSGRRDIVHRVNQIMVGSVGVSTYHKGVLEFPLAASRALKALQQQQFFEMAGAACYFEDLNVEETTFLETISQILQAISNRQITTAIKGIRQIFDASKPHGLYTAETLKASVERVLTNFEIVSRGRELISLANQCRDAAQKVRNCHRYRELQNQVQELTDSIEAQLSEKEYSSHVQRAVAYIHTHYAQIRRVSEVSDMLLLSTEYFCRIFKQETGTTFNNYLTSYRIQTAKKLLETTDMKIADVAEAVGYPNLSYFSRVFKSKTGATPFHYRDSDF